MCDIALPFTNNLWYVALLDAKKIYHCLFLLPYESLFFFCVRLLGDIFLIIEWGTQLLLTIRYVKSMLMLMDPLAAWDKFRQVCLQSS